MPKKVGAIDSLKHKSNVAKGKRLLSCRYHGNDQLKILPPEAGFLVLEKWKITLFEDNAAYLSFKV